MAEIAREGEREIGGLGWAAILLPAWGCACAERAMLRTGRASETGAWVVSNAHMRAKFVFLDIHAGHTACVGTLEGSE